MEPTQPQNAFNGADLPTSQDFTNLKPANGNSAPAPPLLDQTKAVVSDQTAKISNDFSNLAAKKPAPGQPLTHYHSFFYELFTWKHPRATAVTFAIVVGLTLATRYVNILRYAFKGAYVGFFVTTILEWIGRPITGEGFMTSVRPKRYYTIPRESLEAIFAELHELINFFVLEFQQLIYAENIFNTFGAFVVSFVGYFAVKYLPLWGLWLLTNCLLFLGPLTYITYQKQIDDAIAQGNDLVGHHVGRAKDMAGTHAAAASERAKGLAGDLTNRVSTYTRGRTASPEFEPKKKI